MDIRKRRVKKVTDENPYDRREEKITKKAFKSSTKAVVPVAKDTNKTRRAIVKPGVLKKTHR